MKKLLQIAILVLALNLQGGLFFPSALGKSNKDRQTTKYTQARSLFRRLAENSTLRFDSGQDSRPENRDSLIVSTPQEFLMWSQVEQPHMVYNKNTDSCSTITAEQFREKLIINGTHQREVYYILYQYLGNLIYHAYNNITGKNSAIIRLPEITDSQDLTETPDANSNFVHYQSSATIQFNCHLFKNNISILIHDPSATVQISNSLARKGIIINAPNAAFDGKILIENSTIEGDLIIFMGGLPQNSAQQLKLELNNVRIKGALLIAGEKFEVGGNYWVDSIYVLGDIEIEDAWSDKLEEFSAFELVLPISHNSPQE